MGQKVPGSNPTNCFTGKVFSLPFHSLGDQPLVDRGKILPFAFFCCSVCYRYSYAMYIYSVETVQESFKNAPIIRGLKYVVV